MTPPTTGSSWPSAWGSDRPVVTALFIAVTVLLVGAVAWFAVRRSTVFLAAREPSVLFEVDEAIEFVARSCAGEDGPLTYAACALLDHLGRKQALVVILLATIDTRNLAKLIVCEHWNFDGADSWKPR